MLQEMFLGFWKCIWGIVSFLFLLIFGITILGVIFFSIITSDLGAGLWIIAVIVYFFVLIGIYARSIDKKSKNIEEERTIKMNDEKIKKEEWTKRYEEMIAKSEK